jgi:Uma2 family endonuclease
MPESKATPTIEPSARRRDEGDQFVTLRDIGWTGYRTLLRLKGDRRYPKLVYLDGSVTLESPSWVHEDRSERLGMIVSEVAFGCDIPFIPIRSTTIWRKRRMAGSEADVAYYVANEAALRGKTEIDLRVDPPPDLVVEVVHAHGPATAILAWKRLRVPEIWVYEDEELRIVVRRPNGRYVESKSSLAFPFLAPAEVRDWVERPTQLPFNEWMRALRAWVRDIIAPRARGEQP